MRASSSSRKHNGFYCCWILTIAVFFFILINLSQGQPQNYYKGSSDQLPSKALPRIGRRSGVVDLERDDSTMVYENDLNESPVHIYPSLYSNNNEAVYDYPPIGSSAEIEIFNGDLNNRILGEDHIVIPNPKIHFPDRGLIYMWKSFARRESEAAARRGNGGFRQDQPTGIHQFR